LQIKFFASRNFYQDTAAKARNKALMVFFALLQNPYRSLFLVRCCFHKGTGKTIIMPYLAEARIEQNIQLFMHPIYFEYLPE
jgi:hypothetical protein